MKVCHITSVHKRYDVRIFEKECCSLSNAGYDVTLLVADTKKDEIKSKVKIISAKVEIHNRLERMLILPRVLLKKALEIDAEIYHLHDPELLLIARGLLRQKKKVIFDCHEDVVESIKSREWIPKLIRRIIAEVYDNYQKGVIKRLNQVISVTPQIVEKMKAYNLNTELITNYPILSDWKEKNNDEDNICFAGGINSEWCHKEIIRAIQSIKNVQYILAGKCDCKYLKELEKMQGWDYVNYYGQISHKNVMKIYNKSFVGMALNHCRQLGKEGSLGNTKLFEFMEAGLPVICSDYRLWKIIIEENKCGICVNPTSKEEIRKAVQFLCDNRDIAKEMGRAGRKAVEDKYNWKIEEKKLLALYEKLKMCH